uniref:helix-turn-helix domain-containing protein n=1 Tax=Methylobacterium oryzisoli TaxID=3385502 RepID=UPI003891D9C8
MKKYVVTLTAAERDELSGLVSRGKAEVRRLKHAQVLLKADASAAGPGWPDERIAEGVGVGTASVERVRRRFVEEGLERALSPYRKGQRLYARALDGEAEAHLIALACSPPPQGRARWTLRLLASRMVERQPVPGVSHETVRQTLKK